MEQKLRMKDVVDEFNTISNFIKRNSHAGENTYYEHLFLFAKNKNNMWEESLTDEEMVKDYPELFTDGFSEEKKQLVYEDIYNDYDSYEFQDREYDETFYTDYDEFRMGDWDVEEFWHTTDYNGLLPDSSIGFLSDSSDEEEEEYAMYPYNSDEEDEEDERYDPPITRLQKRNQLKLLTATKKLMDCYNNFSYYLFEYMAEQRDYTKHELENKLDDDYMTEEQYRKFCDKVKDKYEYQKESLEIYNDITFIQNIMKKYDYYMFIEDSNDRYKNTMNFIFKLKSDIEVLKTP